MPLENFRCKVKEYLRRGGYYHKQLAYELEMSPALLSNKLYRRNYARLTATEIKQIILTLAKWQLFITRQEALNLLAEMGLGSNSFSNVEWSNSPLCLLADDETFDLNKEEMPLAVGYPVWSKYPFERYELSQDKDSFTPLLFQAKTALARPKSVEPFTIHPTLQLVQNDASRGIQSAAAASSPTFLGEGWQSSPFQLSTFYGREAELAWLEQAVKQHKARLVNLSGLGGIGKTFLALKFVQHVKLEFKFVIWYSLWNAPTPETAVTYFLSMLTGSEPPPKKFQLQLRELLEHLQHTPCLLILDQFETVLAGGQQSGTYLRGYEGYSLLLEMLAAPSHQSCLLLTSREKPRELSLLQFSHPPGVFSLTLPGLTPEASRSLLTESRAGAMFKGSSNEWEQLNSYYSGNPLALKLLSELLQIVFGGNLGAFLAEKCGVLVELAELLEPQLARLSELEQEIVYWLAAGQRARSWEELKAHFQPRVSGKKLLEALVSLGRRS